MGKLHLHKVISDKISEYEDIKWIEIGVRWGRNAKFVLNNFDITKIHLIDPYCELPYLTHIFDAKSVQGYKSKAKLDLGPFEDKCVWYQDYSQNVVDEFEDESIDIIYIDGDHSYEAVLIDLTLFYPKIKEGGLIIGDDYNEGGVKQAIEEYALENDIEYEISNSGDGTDKFWFVK